MPQQNAPIAERTEICGLDIKHDWKEIDSRKDNDAGFMMETVIVTWECSRCKLKHTGTGHNPPDI